MDFYLHDHNYLWQNVRRVSVAWCKYEGEFGRIRKFMKTRGEELQILTHSLLFAFELCKHKAFIFYFFYKIRLRSVPWRDNDVWA